MISNEWNSTVTASVGRKKPNQPDVQKLVLKEARRIEKNCGTFPPHENAERVIHLVFAGTIIQEATSMISRRENLTSLRDNIIQNKDMKFMKTLMKNLNVTFFKDWKKDRSKLNLTTMKFFVATLQNSIEKPRNERDYFIWGVLLTTLEYWNPNKRANIQEEKLAGWKANKRNNR